MQAYRQRNLGNTVNTPVDDLFTIDHLIRLVFGKNHDQVVNLALTDVYQFIADKRIRDTGITVLKDDVYNKLKSHISVIMDVAARETNNKISEYDYYRLADKADICTKILNSARSAKKGTITEIVAMAKNIKHFHPIKLYEECVLAPKPADEKKGAGASMSTDNSSATPRDNIFSTEPSVRKLLDALTAVGVNISIPASAEMLKVSKVPQPIWDQYAKHLTGKAKEIVDAAAVYRSNTPPP